MNYQKNNFISVIMPYYNSEKYISDAIKSILNQTYKNFELILLDDGSKDNSRKIVDSFLDKRIISMNNIKNIGHPASMNKLINSAKGDFIAIMDSDDISHPERLKIQMNYIFEKNLDVCGTSAITFGENENKIIPILEKNKDIRFMMIFGNPIINPSTFSKSSVLKKFLWNENIISSDFDVYSRIIQSNYKIGNITKPYIYSRIHKNQDSSINFKRGINDSYNISKKHYDYYDIKLKDKHHFEKIGFGYKDNISFEDYKNFITSLFHYIDKNNYNLEILSQINVTLIQKININIIQYIILIKIFKKFKIKIEFKHKIILLIYATMKIKSNSFIYKILKIIYYSLFDFQKKNIKK